MLDPFLETAVVQLISNLKQKEGAVAIMDDHCDAFDFYWRITPYCYDAT